MQTASSQQKVRLNDGWEFLKQDLGGVWEAVRPVGNGSPESVPIWQAVVLPHCVNAADAVDPDVHYYQGPSWYRTNVSINNPYKNGRTFLHFEGAGQKTDVYVYTTKVDCHKGGYDEFTVDITEAVAAFMKNPVYQKQFKGKVPVIVRTDNSRDLEMIPSSLSDFNVYGGIYRYLNLVYQPPVSVDKLFVLAETDRDGKVGTLSVKTRLNLSGDIANAAVEVRVFDPAGKAVHQSANEFSSIRGDISVAQITLKNPQLWSTERPLLYRVEITVKKGESVASEQTQVGFRHVEFAVKGPFYLNGKRLLLRGTHRHEDHAGVGAAMTEEMMRTELLLMKEMGVNFLRLGHYQQSRIVLNLCDSLGIIVWEEIPWCRGGLGGETYKKQARRMLTNMIEQHFNHPSVVLWGLGNENDWPGDFNEFDKENIRAFMKELDDLSHQLDNTRKTAIRRCDFCKDIVDVYSPSIWAGWYRGIFTEYKSSSKAEMEKVNHFLHVEWGGDSHAGRHSENPDKALQQVSVGTGTDERAGDASLFGGAARVSKDGDWSESYIVNLFDWHLKEQETMDWLTGSAQWVFKDFSTPIRPDNPVPYMNQKGVLERDFTKKESYYVFQSYWTNKPMVHIYGHSWPVRWGNEAEEKMVKVYSNCSEAELFVNGKSYGVRKRNSQDFPAAGLRWNVKFEAGKNTIKVIAKKGKEVVTDEIEQVYQVEKWDAPASLVLEKAEESADKVLLKVRAVDVNGVNCVDAAAFVEFGITGDGKLVDNQGTGRGSRKVQLQNGRAFITVIKRSGQSVVSVKGEKFKTAFINL